MLASDVVQVPLAVCHQFAVSELVAGHTLIFGDPGASENREMESWKSTRVDLVAS